MNASQISAILESIKSVARPGAFNAAVRSAAPDVYDAGYGDGQETLLEEMEEMEEELERLRARVFRPKRVIPEALMAKMREGRMKFMAEKAAKEAAKEAGMMQG